MSTPITTAIRFQTDRLARLCNWLNSFHLEVRHLTLRGQSLRLLFLPCAAPLPFARGVARFTHLGPCRPITTSIRCSYRAFRYLQNPSTLHARLPPSQHFNPQISVHS
jgi:hypothetical protein